MSQNANVAMCNLALTDPARSVVKHLDFYSRPVVFLCCIVAAEAYLEEKWLSCACPAHGEEGRLEAVDGTTQHRAVEPLCAFPKPSSDFLLRSCWDAICVSPPAVVKPGSVIPALMRITGSLVSGSLIDSLTSGQSWKNRNVTWQDLSSSQSLGLCYFYVAPTLHPCYSWVTEQRKRPLGSGATGALML